MDRKLLRLLVLPSAVGALAAASALIGHPGTAAASGGWGVDCSSSYFAYGRGYEDVNEYNYDYPASACGNDAQNDVSVGITQSGEDNYNQANAQVFALNANQLANAAYYDAYNELYDNYFGYDNSGPILQCNTIYATCDFRVFMKSLGKTAPVTHAAASSQAPLASTSKQPIIKPALGSQ